MLVVCTPTPHIVRRIPTTRSKMDRVSTAPLLDARYGNLGLGVGGDQHRRVQDPVLFGTDQFFALDEQQANVALALDSQIGHRTLLVSRCLSEHGRKPTENQIREADPTNEPIRRGRGKPHMCEQLYRDGVTTVYVCP
jgi:hypothetical protein